MKRIFKDQMKRLVEIDFPPKRIVSLVPSQTELLYHLGLNEEVVGQTVFCIHPPEMHKIKPKVGGTKKLQLDKIAQLKPDLVIGNKEENEQSQILELMKLYPVWMSDVENLEDALDMIEKVGEMVDRGEVAKEIADKIRIDFEKLEVRTQNSDQRRAVSQGLISNFRPLTSCAYLIWRNPYMAAGHDTFINNMLKHCGLKNVFEEGSSRYPEITKGKLQAANPSLIILSSEPYPFKQKHIEELTVICPGARIILVDGEMFSWYGSRLLKSAEYFLKFKNS